MAYDQNNIFAKIIRGEIPCDKVFENDHVLAFKDIAPQAPVHVLVIPKGAYIDIADFNKNAGDEEILAFNRAVSEIIGNLGLDNGLRTISNQDEHGGQEVPHYHLHLLGGEPLGPMLVKS
ncbi:MAG: histidine triad nucleotide-binding protein [Pseudomonadota bacterium]